MEKTTLDRRRRALLRSAVGMGVAASLPFGGGRALAATAGTWPTRTVRLVVAQGAGSTGDSLMRLIAPRLEALWKQSVVVENRPGAGSIVGTQYVAGTNDDHTIMLATLSSVLPKFTVKNLRYDPAVDLIPIYHVMNYHITLVASPELVKKAPTLPDIIKLSQSTPGGLFFSGTGPTSIFNMMMAVVNKSLGINYTSVDFNSIPDMIMAVLRGDAQLSVAAPFNIKSQIDAGDLVPVVAFSRTRYPVLPNVPAIVEAADYKGHVPLSWGGIFGPRSLPKEAIDIVGRDVGVVLSDPIFRKDLETRLGGTVVDSSPEEFAKEYASELQMWEDVVASLNITPA